MAMASSSARAAAFKDAFERAGKRLDMGKSCVRFTSLDDLPLQAIGDAIAGMSVDDDIAYYEQTRPTKAAKKPAKKPAKKTAKKAAAKQR